MADAAVYGGREAAEPGLLLRMRVAKSSHDG
jgi:hypothetical protein